MKLEFFGDQNFPFIFVDPIHPIPILKMLNSYKTHTQNLHTRTQTKISDHERTKIFQSQKIKFWPKVNFFVKVPRNDFLMTLSGEFGVFGKWIRLLFQVKAMLCFLKEMSKF